ncbi:MAG TPA: hypothetical protein VGC76_01640 [Pyrinomonadaceae bacterium]|jgi:hypothetical protein
MIELQLSYFAKARVWLSELPPIDIQSTEIFKRVLPSQPGHVKDICLAGIELYVPIGAKINYALLAGKFMPDATEHLSIEMSVTVAGGDLLTWALASNVDKVRAGLAEEYAAAVLNGMSGAAGMLGSGVLTLGPAAHGVISSSPNMFTAIAKALLSILKANPRNLSDETTSQILKGFI